MSNIDAVKQIMGELKNLRNNQDEKVANIEQQMKSLKEAQRLTEEAVYRADSVEVTGTDSELKKFVNKDALYAGPLERLKSKQQLELRQLKRLDFLTLKKIFQTGMLK